MRPGLSPHINREQSALIEPIVSEREHASRQLHDITHLFASVETLCLRATRTFSAYNSLPHISRYAFARPGISPHILKQANPVFHSYHIQTMATIALKRTGQKASVRRHCGCRLTDLPPDASCGVSPDVVG